MIRSIALAFALSSAVTAPLALAESSAAVSAVHEQGSVGATAPTASHDDASSYASREQHDKQTANYEGGSLVVVGISGGTLLVVLILLLILL